MALLESIRRRNHAHAHRSDVFARPVSFARIYRSPILRKLDEWRFAGQGYGVSSRVTRRRQTRVTYVLNQDSNPPSKHHESASSAEGATQTFLDSKRSRS